MATAVSRLPKFIGGRHQCGKRKPGDEEIQAWCVKLEECLALSDTQISAVCANTAEQSSSPLWYKERVCRLTSSKFGLICKRRQQKMESLVEQLLYTEPPVTVSALHLGRTKDPVIVERYIALKEKDMCLVDVAGTGLHVHPR